MNPLKKIITSLPDKMQDSLMETLMKKGTIFDTPIWDMLFRVIDFMGLEKEQVKSCFRLMKTMDINSTTACRLTGNKLRRMAEKEERNKNTKIASECYFQACGFYLLSDLFLYKPEEEETNYFLALPCYDKYIDLSGNKTEKVGLLYKEGEIKAYLHLPEGKGPFPAIIFTQGNEGVKEAMHMWAQHAVGKGIAVFNGEPPGWGESGLTGIHFRSSEDMKAYVDLSIEYLEKREDIDSTRIGIFGISYGGFSSLYCAGLNNKIKAAGGIGAPFLDVNKVRQGALAAQRRKSYKISGAKDDNEHSKIMDSLNSEQVLKQIKCPILLIHGEKDLLFDGQETNNAFRRILNVNIESRVIKNGDHMCSQFLKDYLVDEIFNWYKDKL